MKIRTMKLSVVLGGCLCAAFAAAPARADFVLANWTFETSIPATSGPFAAEAGLFGGNASGSHASGAVVYSSPAGNGSTHSFSSNQWAVGDYYQFTTSTLTYSNITISWDETSSATGPRDFVLQYSTDNVSYTNFATYSITSPAVSWSTATPVLTTSYSFNLNSVPALNNATTIYFRMGVTSTTAVNGSAIGTAGTDRIDNVVISAAVPAPGALALLGLAGLVGSRRRRR